MKKPSAAGKQPQPFPRRPSVILSEDMRKELKLIQSCHADFSNSDTLRHVLRRGLDALGGIQV